MKLSQCYTFKGKTYGENGKVLDVDVPEDFPVENVKKMEKDFAARAAARDAEKNGVAGVNDDGLGYVQGAVDEKGHVKTPLRNGKKDESAARGAGASVGVSDDELSDMTKAELEDYASSNNIDLGDAKTKAEMIDAIKASRG